MNKVTASQRRIVLPISCLILAAIAITGCGAQDSEALISSDVEGPDRCARGGEGVQTVLVSENFGSTPEVEFETPLASVVSERLVILEGDGEVVADGDSILIHYSLFGASSGNLIENSGYDGGSAVELIVSTEEPVLVGFSLTAACSSVGSRVVGLVPAREAFGPDGLPGFGLAAGESVLFVVDILEIMDPPEKPLDGLEGETVDPPEGFPGLSFDSEGLPEITVPGGDPPSDFESSVLIKGTGQIVEDGDVVIVHYHGVNWSTGVIFDSSFIREEPASFPTGGVIEGFRLGLIGQAVGSRLMLVIPPELGYGPSGGTADGSIGAEDTIIFVVDILGIQ